jgi:hypothetical protein
MNTSAHPSPEALSAYFDKEQALVEGIDVESHLSGCAQCRAELEWFGLLNELGPRIEESLPGESYWKDLPDRVMQRLLMADARPAEPAPTGGFWQRLLGPRPAWRYAMAGAATLAVAAGVWVTVHHTPNPWAPNAGSELATNEAASRAPGASTSTEAISLPKELQPSRSPASESAKGFAQRIFLTYGSRDNPGTSLDLTPGQVVPDQGGSRVGTQASQVGLLNPDMQALANEVVGYSCGEDSLGQAYMASLRAEQEGDYRTAALGYQLLMGRVGPEHRLYQYSEYRLSYLAWKVRMANAISRQSQALAELNRLADRTYQDWEKSGREIDCRKAWRMNRVLQQIGPEMSSPALVQHTSTRIAQLKNCSQ